MKDILFLSSICLALTACSSEAVNESKLANPSNLPVTSIENTIKQNTNLAVFRSFRGFRDVESSIVEVLSNTDDEWLLHGFESPDNGTFIITLIIDEEVSQIKFYSRERNGGVVQISPKQPCLANVPSYSDLKNDILNRSASRKSNDHVSGRSSFVIMGKDDLINQQNTYPNLSGLPSEGVLLNYLTKCVV